MTKEQQIDQFIKEIKIPKKTTILFFNYSAKSKWYNPFLLATKLYYHLNGKAKIDHCGHIIWSNIPNIPKLFEANIKLGIIKTDLKERLMHFKGKVYAVQIDDNFPKERLWFEWKYFAHKYDLIQAIASAVDNFKWFNRYVKKRKMKGYFCSILVAKLGLLQADETIINVVKKAGGAENVSPPELFEPFYQQAKVLRLK